MKSTTSRLRIGSDVDVALARIAGAVLAYENDLGVVGRYYIVSSVTELASKILRDSGSGSVELQVLTEADDARSIQIVAQRRGPRVEDVESKTQERFSVDCGSRSRLPQVRKLASELHLASGLNVESVVLAKERLNERVDERENLWKKWPPRLTIAARMGASAV